MKIKEKIRAVLDEIAWNLEYHAPEIIALIVSLVALALSIVALVLKLSKG